MRRCLPLEPSDDQLTSDPELCRRRFWVTCSVGSRFSFSEKPLSLLLPDGVVRLRRSREKGETVLVNEATRARTSFFNILERPGGEGVPPPRHFAPDCDRASQQRQADNLEPSESNGVRVHLFYRADQVDLISPSPAPGPGSGPVSSMWFQ